MNTKNTGRMDDTLERLGVEELEERLELTPLVTGDDPGDGGGDGCCRDLCDCTITVPQPKMPDFWVR
jgi:hypothetical protein